MIKHGINGGTKPRKQQPLLLLTITSNNITMEHNQKLALSIILTPITIIVCLGLLIYGVHNYSKEYHTCTDPTHEKCDGECPCDGFECPPIKADSHAIQQCDYHMTILNDTYTMFTEDGDTVKVFKYGEFPILDSVVDADNL